MTIGKTQSVAVNQSIVRSRRPRWRQTISGVTVLTLGFQGTAANAVNGANQPLNPPNSQASLTHKSVEGTAVKEPVTNGLLAPESVQSPRFSAFGWRPILHSNQPSDLSLSIARLREHRRQLHRHSNDVEYQLLGIQQLLSLQAYGNSFADHLLTEHGGYQSKLQQVRHLEVDIHRAIEQDDATSLGQLQFQLQSLDQELRILAQQQLQQYIKQAPGKSGLWQEPMYLASLEWLMQYTHERHLLKARQQTLAQTLVAMAID